MFIKAIVFLFIGLEASAKLNVVATSPDIGAIVSEVAGDEVNLEMIAKGSQDLHFVETKPSYMVKLNKADLIIANGLGLEVGWLPLVIRGARNPKLNFGALGNLDLGENLDPIEVPGSSVSRAQGDVHPEGNPHWTLDPVRVGKAAELIAQRLGQLDASHAQKFNERAKSFNARLVEKTKEWQKRIQNSGVTKVVTYHRTLNYFLQRFNLEGVGYLEPKPGIPPSAQHILQMISKVKSQNVRLILVEHYFDPKVAEKVAKDVSGIKVQSVAVAVEAVPNIRSNIDLFENLVKVIEAAK